MVDEAAGLLSDGAAALAEGDWPRAQGCFTRALVLEESGAAHFGLGDALWWQGEIAAAIRHREQASSAFLREDRPANAASAALRLAVDYHSNMGNRAASAGWLQRARTIVREHNVGVLEGWLDMVDAFTTSEPSAAEVVSRQAVDRARRTGDADLELQALSVLGSALVAQGRVNEGVARLDEAMAGSLGGQRENPQTVVFTSCNMIKACTSCADFERVVEWVLAADHFQQTFGCAFLYASCRTQYGRVMTMTGEWTQAEQELTRALAAAEGSLPAVHADAAAALADLRLRQGRIEEAQALVADIEGSTEAVSVSAALQLRRGRIAAAEALLTRGLARVDAGGLTGGLFTEQLGEAALQREDAATAAAHARSVIDAGVSNGCRILKARGRRLAGRAAAHAGDLETSRAELGAAISTFHTLGCVHEAARARAALAAAFEGVEPEVAVMEGRAAHAVFDALGAAPDADETAALLRRLGERVTSQRAKGDQLLTAREREVLELLREGLSNPEIAERLFISRRTVEHHVAHILAKLDVRSRTEAALHPTAGSVGR